LRLFRGARGGVVAAAVAPGWGGLPAFAARPRRGGDGAGAPVVELIAVRVLLPYPRGADAVRRRDPSPAASGSDGRTSGRSLNRITEAKVQCGRATIPWMNADRSERTAELRFRHPVDAVFEMFPPQGERAWAEGWDPMPIHPPDETGVRDAVFSTEHGGAHAVWFVLELDRTRHVVQYLNVVAGTRITRVDVACEALGP